MLERLALRLACLGICVLCVVPAAADCAHPWNHLRATGRNFLEPWPLALTASAVTTPVVFSSSGLDHELRLTAQSSLGGRYDIEPVSLWAPHVLLGGAVLGYGISLTAASCEAQELHSAMLQAAILSMAVVATAKWASGRSWPNGGANPRAPGRLQNQKHSREFSPFAGGLAAFPSGHTAVAFAMAAALRSRGRELGGARFIGYPLSAAIGLAMWYGDHHWASDVLSGAMLGEAIGLSVGDAFGHEGEDPNVRLVPTSREGAMLLWSGTW